MNDAELRVFREELRATACEIRRHALTVALSVPAVWGLAELRAHYPAISSERIKALLRKHCGYRGRQGCAIAVHVDQVRMLDAALGEDRQISP